MIQDPKTKIEAFDAQQGTVVIRGFSNIGELKGVYGGVVSVESRELTHAATGRKEFGIAIDVKETSGLERQSWSFIDYDEIDPLVNGIDYISKIDASVTRLDNFQADYRTKGDLLISTFSSSSGENLCSIESGQIGSPSIFLNVADLARFRRLIISAKTKLDSIKGN